MPTCFRLIHTSVGFLHQQSKTCLSVAHLNRFNYDCICLSDEHFVNIDGCFQKASAKEHTKYYTLDFVKYNQIIIVIN